MVFVFLIIIIRSLYYFFFLNFGFASGDVLVNHIPPATCISSYNTCNYLQLELGRLMHARLYSTKIKLVDFYCDHLLIECPKYILIPICMPSLLTNSIF